MKKLLLLFFTTYCTGLYAQTISEAVKASQVFDDGKVTASVAKTLSVAGNTIQGLVDDFTNEPVTYTKVTRWEDGSALNDSKVDGVIYRKRGNEYYRRNIVGSDINVRWYGAKGDGRTDDIKAINAALQFASSVSDVSVLNRSRVLNLIFPAGVYVITGTIRQSDNSRFAHLVGMADATILYKGNGTAIHIGNTTSHGIMPVEIKNLTIQKENTSKGSVGLLLEHAGYAKVFNVGFVGFETAFLNKGSIGVLADGGGKGINGAINGIHVVSSQSDTKGVLRFASNKFTLMNYNLGGGTVNGVIIEPGKGVNPATAGGMITLDRILFEGVEGTAIRIVNNGEVHKLDVVQLRDCWFEHYGKIGVDIYNSNVTLYNSFFAGAKQDVVVLNDNNSKVTFKDTHGYFLDSKPANGILVKTTNGATKAAYKNIRLNNSNFRGLFKIHADYPVSSAGIDANEHEFTVNYDANYPSRNNDYNRNLSLNVFNEIEKLVGETDYTATLTFVGNDGTHTTGLLSLTIVKKGNGYLVRDNSLEPIGYRITGTGRNTIVTITDNTTGRWFNSKGIYNIKVL